MRMWHIIGHARWRKLPRSPLTEGLQTGVVRMRHSVARSGVRTAVVQLNDSQTSGIPLLLMSTQCPQ
jgi:hypothetical protein